MHGLILKIPFMCLLILGTLFDSNFLQPIPILNNNGSNAVYKSLNLARLNIVISLLQSYK